MAQVLIKNRRVEADVWHATDTSKGSEGQAVVVPLADWLQNHASWLAHQGPLGVALEPGDDPQSIAGDLAKLDLVTIRFPSFTDGRGYSSARLLREKYHFQGEIRAVGDVFQDVLFYLHRVGFDAFLLRDGEDPEAAIRALDTFSEGYQASVDRPDPLFRRRLSAHG